MNKLLTILGFAILAGIIVFKVVLVPDPITPVVLPAVDGAGIIITIGDAGFNPKESSAKLGDTVTFKNIDTIGHWPASDPHPAHTIYSEFDPRKSLAPGESWSFTFDKPGMWRFHDHEDPLFEGKIIVTDPSAPVVAPPTTEPTTTNKKKVLTPCDTTSADFYCFEEYYKQLVAEKGVPTAMADLRKRYDASAYVRSQCHPITHVIGRAATLLYPRVSEAYAHGDAVCWSGYYHGVMEGIISKIGKKNILAQISTICDDIPTKASYSFDYYNCVHGLGHGVMALTNNELFESLEMCDKILGNWEQTSCYGGVFMENVIVDNKNHFTKYLRPAEPIYPCNAVNMPHKQACYLMQTSYMLKVNGNDFSKVIPLCRQVDPGFESTCFQSLGRDASGQSISDPIRTKAICDMGADFAEKSNCLIGAVKDFVSYHHSDVQARQLCAMFPEDLHKMCDDTVTSYYASF